METGILLYNVLRCSSQNMLLSILILYSYTSMIVVMPVMPVMPWVFRAFCPLKNTKLPYNNA